MVKLEEKFRKLAKALKTANSYCTRIFKKCNQNS